MMLFKAPQQKSDTSTIYIICLRILNVNEFIKSKNFQKAVSRNIKSRQGIFDEPENWQSKQLTDSPLINDFTKIWQQLKETYT